MSLIEIDLSALDAFVQNAWAASEFDGWNPEDLFAATSGWKPERIVQLVVLYIQLNGSFANERKVARRADPTTVQAMLMGVKARASKKEDVTLSRIATCYPHVLIQIRKKFSSKLRVIQPTGTIPVVYQDNVLVKMLFALKKITDPEMESFCTAQGALVKTGPKALETTLGIMRNTATFPASVISAFTRVASRFSDGGYFGFASDPSPKGSTPPGLPPTGSETEPSSPKDELSASEYGGAATSPGMAKYLSKITGKEFTDTTPEGDLLKVMKSLKGFRAKIDPTYLAKLESHKNAFLISNPKNAAKWDAAFKEI